jgi:uncharacterized protein YjbI with pentapeptide repeats
MSNRMADRGKAKIAELLAAYTIGRHDLHGWQVAGASLEGVNLGETDVRGADFARSNLCDASLRSANLKTLYVNTPSEAYASIHLPPVATCCAQLG